MCWRWQVEDICGDGVDGDHGDHDEDHDEDDDDDQQPNSNNAAAPDICSPLGAMVRGAKRRTAR